jgi:hypothetical protein
MTAPLTRLPFNFAKAIDEPRNMSIVLGLMVADLEQFGRSRLEPLLFDEVWRVNVFLFHSRNAYPVLGIREKSVEHSVVICAERFRATWRPCIQVSILVR